jgi:hypothetical protein
MWNRVNATTRGSVPWYPREPGGPFLTLVARLPELADSLAGFRQELRLVAPAEHHYEPQQLHVTILNLDAARGRPLHEVRDVVSASLARCGRLALTFGQPEVSRWSIYLSAVDESSRLAALRRDLRHRLGIGSPPQARAFDQLAFCNIMRFARRGPCHELARWLRTARAPAPSGISLGHAELVETDKVLSDERTRVLARVGLTASP